VAISVTFCDLDVILTKVATGLNGSKRRETEKQQLIIFSEEEARKLTLDSNARTGRSIFYPKPATNRARNNDFDALVFRGIYGRRLTIWREIQLS
jgi:hypothetical protein